MMEHKCPARFKLKKALHLFQGAPVRNPLVQPPPLEQRREKLGTTAAKPGVPIPLQELPQRVVKPPANWINRTFAQHQPCKQQGLGRLIRESGGQPELE
jgi:hypothetical protein